jgi:hypothetical protein
MRRHPGNAGGKMHTSLEQVAEHGDKVRGGEPLLRVD